MDKQQIKTWLKLNKKNQQWLADQCKLSRRAIETWMSDKGKFPESAQEFIKLIIEREEAKKARPQAKMKTIVLQFTDDEFALLQKYAEKYGLTLEDVAESNLLAMAKGIKNVEFPRI